MKKVIYQRPNHFSHLKVMREQNQLCDMTIQVETQLFPVHRCIIAGTIEYFKTMLLCDFKENQEEIISMKNITAINMKALIDFAYTGEIILTEDTVQSLIKDADYLMLFEVKEECAKFLESTLNSTNVYKIYCVAEELSCIHLKEQSHKLMRENIQDIVQTEEFLGYNYGFLMDILIDNDLLSPTTQFEALMRWIISDFEERKIHLSEILSCSNFFKLTTEYLTDSIFKEDVIAALSESEHKNFVVDVLSLYRKLKKTKIELKERIVIVDFNGRTDIYDLYNNKWKSLETTETGGSIWHNFCAVHENQLYKVSEKFGLQRLNLQEKKFETLPSVDFKPRRCAGICSLNDYLYVCGGTNAANSILKDVMRYCPTTKEWRQMSSMQTARCMMAVVALSGQLYAIGGIYNSGLTNMVERYDPQRDCWTTLPSLQCIRSDAGAAVLNGKIFVCGGYSDSYNTLDSVEVYDPIANRWDFVATMNEARRNALVVAHEWKLWAFGGLSDHKGLSSVEVYDSEQNSWSYVSEMPTCKGCISGGILHIIDF